jgi:SHS2 domain-containing protein
VKPWMKRQTKFRYLDHKSDVLFKAFGKNLKEAIENSADAMFSTISKINKIKPTMKIKIHVKADNLENLIIETLNLVLAKGDAKEIFFKKIKIEKLNIKKPDLTATAYGCRQKPELGKIVVKAATFHEFELKKNKKNKKWSVRILLDI